MIRNYIKKIEMNTYFVHGDKKRLHLGKNVSTVNTFFNTRSGSITIGDETIFGHNCMLITGIHEFFQGKRKKISKDTSDVPDKGRDIYIGKGCWIASGAIILGPVKIGDNSIVAAGSVVNKDVPSGKFVAGVPAKIKRDV